MNTHPNRTPLKSVSQLLFTHLVTVSGFLAACVLVTGCRTAKVTSEKHLGDEPTQSASIVYVEDFDLGAKGVESEEGVLSRIPVVGKGADRELYGHKPPAVQARELIDLMSRSLIADIEKTGCTARRLAPGDPMPANGWLVRGVFTKVQEGNRLRRAMIGFGLGKTDLQVLAKFDDLSKGTPEPFYEMNTDSNSGHLPGAAPMLVVSPYAAPVRFVLAGKDLDRDVRRTATSISQALSKELSGH